MFSKLLAKLTDSPWVVLEVPRIILAMCVCVCVCVRVHAHMPHFYTDPSISVIFSILQSIFHVHQLYLV